MKLLTDELIEAAMHELGFSEKQISEQNHDFIQLVLDHYDAKVSDRWEQQDLYVYEESTRDGYSVWVCTHDPNSVCINEDIFYQDHSSQIIDEVQDAIRNGLSIYCDTEGIINDAIEDMSDRIYDDVRADVEMEFHNKGYEWPSKVPELLKEIKQLLTDEGLNKHQKIVDKITTAIEQLNIAD
jgi:glutamine synthetase